MLVYQRVNMSTKQPYIKDTHTHTHTHTRTCTCRSATNPHPARKSKHWKRARRRWNRATSGLGGEKTRQNVFTNNLYFGTGQGVEVSRVCMISAFERALLTFGDVSDHSDFCIRLRVDEGTLRSTSTLPGPRKSSMRNLLHFPLRVRM